jgi:hypothetical protein
MAWPHLKQYNMLEDVDLLLTQILVSEGSYKNLKGNYKLWEKQINNKIARLKLTKKSKIIFKNRTLLLNKIKEELKVIWTSVVYKVLVTNN